MSKPDEDVPANKKLRLALHFMIQDYIQGGESTQLEVQHNINLELIKKNIKNDEPDFALLPPLSIQEKKVYVEVSNLSEEDVKNNLRKILSYVTQSFQENKDFEFIVPSRCKSYTVFKRHLVRRLLTKHDTRRSYYGANSKLCTSTVFVLLTIYNKCFIGKPQYIKKRAIYYIDTSQFKSEYDAYRVIDDVCCMLSCTMPSLRVISDSTGKVIGPFTFMCDDTPYDCSSSAKEIPSCHRIVRSFKNCEASCILLVEKNTVFHDLAQAKFHENVKCIMVSGKGYGDRSTKVFLRQLYYGLKLPVLALVDCNPYGIQILFDYRFGSVNKSYDSINLATPYIRWLGVRPSDLEKYKINVQGNDLGKKAISTAKNFLKQDFVKMDDKWVSKIKKMLEIGKSINIDSLCCKGSRYLSMEFLPQKLESKDWI